ncbi:ATP-binding protein [Gallaecimonas xiamenensis]|uniref:histidine kinase n=1 Tax=Gallaecimonas xiamenensis 3-C-1 TaxID=745411 RepID=K2JZ62_9GAMM|nr:ATP-binding protein [Gallaecimonas xiamenensis]EKE70575.1 signal transduction histidine-protein kinase BaeS [Gallaecimonas xiamenensis 3-C-1]
MLSSIKGKLLLAIATMQIAVLIAAMLATAWVFDRGLETYQASVEEQRLTPIVQSLGDAYQSHGNSWQWLYDDRCFVFSLIQRYLLEGTAPGPVCQNTERGLTMKFDDGQAHFNGGKPLLDWEFRPAPPHPMPMPPVGGEEDSGSLLSPMVYVFDADGDRVAGPPRASSHIQYKAIMAGEQLVGYLGYVPRTMLGQSIVRAFKQQQLWGYLVVLVVAMVLTVGVAIVLARWFGSPVQRLADGTRALTQGESNVRVEVAGRDEFARLARDFNRLSDTLQQNREARQQWIADISHDLRTPLSVLKGELEAHQDGIRTWTPQSLSSLICEVNQLVRLVDDLHVLTVSEMGAVNYQFKPLDLSQMLWRNLELYAAGLSRKGLRLSVNIKNNLWVLGDSGYLSRLLDNLMKNTLAYTDSPGKLHIELAASGGEVLLHWADSSPGVSEASLSRLTERLYRDERSRNKGSGGSGLGLAIAEAIVQAHGGLMQAQHSALGGLSWIIRMPQEEQNGDE